MLYDSFFFVCVFFFFSSVFVCVCVCGGGGGGFTALSTVSQLFKCNSSQIKFALGRVKNIMGKGENAGYHNVFRRLLCLGR